MSPQEPAEDDGATATPEAVEVAVEDAPEPPPYALPKGLVAAGVVVNTIMGLGALGLAVWRGVEVFIDGCVFCTDCGDFDKFRASGSYCDLPLVASIFLSLYLSIESQADLAAILLFMMTNKLFAQLGTAAFVVLQVIRVVLMGVVVGTKWQFEKFVLPLVLYVCLGVVQLLLTGTAAALLPHPPPDAVDDAAAAAADGGTAAPAAAGEQDADRRSDAPAAAAAVGDDEAEAERGDAAS